MIGEQSRAEQSRGEQSRGEGRKEGRKERRKEGRNMKICGGRKDERTDISRLFTFSFGPVKRNQLRPPRIPIIIFFFFFTTITPPPLSSLHLHVCLTQQPASISSVHSSIRPSVFDSTPKPKYQTQPVKHNNTKKKHSKNTKEEKKKSFLLRRSQSYRSFCWVVRMIPIQKITNEAKATQSKKRKEKHVVSSLKTRVLREIKIKI